MPNALINVTSLLHQSSVLASTPEAVRQQEQVSAEKGISQQLQVLQVQDQSRTSPASLSDHQAKRQCMETQTSSQKQQESEQCSPMPVRVHSDQQSARNSRSESSVVLGDGQSMKLEIGPNELANQGGTDPFWRSNALTQATQVQYPKFLRCFRFYSMIVILFYHNYDCPIPILLMSKLFFMAACVDVGTEHAGLGSVWRCSRSM